MSVKYRLVKKKNMGKDQEEVPEKMYAQPVYMELVSFESLLDEIVEAGIPTNQVKGVIDRMNYLIRKHLASGRRAYFGDTHPGISVISTQFVSYKMAFGCKFIISFLNSHLLSQNDAKSVQFCPGSHQQ